MNRALVIADHRSGELRVPTTSQSVSAARSLAGEGAEVALLVAAPELGRLEPAVAEVAVDKVFLSETPPVPAAVAATAGSLAHTWSADFVVFVHGPEAMATAPLVVVQLDGCLVTDVLAVSAEEERPTVTRPLYGGKVSADLELADGVPAVLTIRAGIFEPGETRAAPPEIEHVPSAGKVSGYEHLGFLEPETDDIDISRTELLVAAGRGIGEQENLKELEALAYAMQGELAVSRPLVDAGWVPSSRLVGQSGRTVKPKVYLAFGISGAVQHLAGIRDAGAVIAINADPEAPIFQVARFGAVADALDVAESLTEIYRG